MSCKLRFARSDTGCSPAIFIKENGKSLRSFCIQRSHPVEFNSQGRCGRWVMVHDGILAVCSDNELPVRWRMPILCKLGRTQLLKRRQ